ncbi:MAG: PfkB family carbohydrate kinase [Candidatus Jordarchaeales archaeon]
MYDLTVIGHLTIDFISRFGVRLRKSVGGPPFYCSLTARALGAKVAVVSKTAVGEDLREFSSLLGNAGISTFILSGKATTTFEIDYRGEKRNLRLISRAENISINEVPSESLKASVVLLSPVAGELSLDFVKALPRYRESGCHLIAGDLQGFTRIFHKDGKMSFRRLEEDFFSLFDIIKGSEREVKAVTGCRSVEEALKQITYFGPKIAIATLGEKGALALSEGLLFRVHPLRPESVVDTTGAGDAFIAAFLVGYAWSMSLEDCLKLACSAATCTVERKLPLGGANKEYIVEKSKNVRIEKISRFES